MKCRHSILLAVLGSLPLFACGKAAEPPPPTGGTDGACESNSECDDGSYCNGPERCAPDAAGADAAGCVGGEAPCDDGRCSEKKEECLASCSVEPDADGDDSVDIACGGDDCDDGDPARYPGNLEVCDDKDLDEDCDEKSFGERDADDDGYVDAECCNGTEDARSCGDDCDDSEEGTHPSEAEQCDGIDNDCDESVDEGFECKRGDEAVACTTASGLEGGRACTSTCELATCQAEEVCNGLDDDGKNGADNGFSCVKADLGTACETLCGTQGVGTCDDECAGVESCVAPADICNYCDDNLASGFNEEKPLATAIQEFHMPHGATFTGAAIDLEPIETGPDGTKTINMVSQLLTGGTNTQVGGIWFALGSRVGWGPIEFEVAIQVQGPEEMNGPAYGGWGVELLSGEPRGGSASAGGMVRAGLGIEWSWGHPGDSSHSATSSDTFRVRGASDPAFYQDLPGGIAHQSSAGLTTQRLHIRYTPEDPSTPELEEEFLVKNGKNGVVIARVPDPNFQDGPWLNNVLPIGSTFGIAVTAASNGAPFLATVHVQEVVIENNIATETFYNSGSISGLCP